LEKFMFFIVFRVFQFLMKRHHFSGASAEFEKKGVP